MLIVYLLAFFFGTAFVLTLSPIRRYVDQPTVNFSQPIEPPQILLWSHFGYPWDNTTLPSHRGFLTLPCVPNGTNVCYVTKSRDDIHKSDAIVFNAESADSADLPSDRRCDQVWVFLTSGSPRRPIPKVLLQSTPPFNWTMAFREDADIVAPYRLWGDTSTNNSASSLVGDFGDKIVTAFWMISECEQEKLKRTSGSPLVDNRWSGTERFIDSVLHNFDVSLINDCGAETCASTDECLRLMQHIHVFVIVMESSACFGHPAELIYASLKYDIIPVLFGVGKFKHSLPPNAFVDTTNLSREDAISVLRSISRSPHFYAHFIAKRRHFSVSRPPILCALCSAMYAPPKKSWHGDLVHWWQRRSTCSLRTSNGTRT
ncbi:alpha-(1,3)-fucosyltransferase C-like [Dermacentor silvarum]|uniref:alpha-(1,3)-fucosyltransferase C-like n=1 Tax=Dermacentor silvarum TaxID=543639 RepID=UPI0021015250|nr:alpha-(1,3)-fucosyltransferase C-like [Dermacentor silvarum]